MSFRASVLAFLFAALQLPALAQKEPEPLDKAYLHSETGVIMPKTIADTEIDSVHEYDQPELGISLRYWGEEGEKTDVYIFHRGIENLADDAEHSLIHREIQGAVDEIKYVAREYGIYKDVFPGEKTTERDYKLGADKLSVISIPVRFSVVDNPKVGFEPGPKDSFIAVAIFRGNFFKIRRTVAADPDNGKANEESIEAFIDEWARLIIETSRREVIRKEIGPYLADPLSEKNQITRAALIEYAIDSPLVLIEIDAQNAPWLAVEDYPGGEDLLAGFVAGNIEAQFENLDFRNQAYPGMLAALKVYEELKTKRGAPEIAKMEEFRKLEAEGKLEQLLSGGE